MISMGGAEAKGFRASSQEMILCPACWSPNCILEPTARKAGIWAGGILGAVISAGAKGAILGAANCTFIARTVSHRLLVTITGAIGGAMFGFAFGALAGHDIATEIDHKILRFFKCRDCQFEFKA